jgi:alpha-L-fucosidase
MKIAASLGALMLAALPLRAEESMDKMWGGPSDQKQAGPSSRTQFFQDGNYGMFIHWGLFSHLGGQWKDQTFYGIGEWIKRQMRIPDAEYMALARDFNPVEFNAREVARVAKESGMKWIIITSKHHEGFAMFKSAHPFNIVDATPFKRDPMKELAAACKEAGLGFGFYYSHNQDWTAPGGSGGPAKNPDGSPASFAQYFKDKCHPQVQEICTGYGPLKFVWFDTPGNMPKEHVLELVALVKQHQPGALMCSRVGHGLGDYDSRGDMEVPLRNSTDLWETCDTTDDSWSYAWYDQNWKDSREILNRLVATVGRGGTYLLNIGLDGKGRVPEGASKYLIKTGAWIKRYPKVIYAAGPSPFGHALPWGDATTQGNTLQLVIFDWPDDGQLFVPGLQSEIASAAILQPGGDPKPVAWKKQGTWTEFTLPRGFAPDRPASVLEVQLKSPPKADETLGIYPNCAAELPVEFATVTNATKKKLSWMEKFGEWKFAVQASAWKPDARCVWTVDVARAGDYYVDLVYKGKGRTAWVIETGEGVKLQNQQSATSVYHAYPFGMLTFKKPGRHTLTVFPVSGFDDGTSLKTVVLRPAE